MEKYGRLGQVARTETTLMIVPPLRAIIPGATARVKDIVPLIFTSRTSKARERRGSSCSRVEIRDIPALLIKMSTGPNLSSVSLTARSGAAGSVTSATIARAGGWSRERISSTRLSRSERVRDRHATEAPAAAKARAVARPIPRPAPVMRTTFDERVEVCLEGWMKG